MTAPLRSSDYELRLGNGRVLVFEGHPSYCPRAGEHEPHLFSYVRLDHDGLPVKGRYRCDGTPMTWAKRP